MAKRSLLEDLTHLPWQVSVVLSVAVYFIFKFVLPIVVTPNPISQPLLQALDNFAIYISAILLLPAPFAYFNTKRKRQRFEVQQSLDTIKQLNWQQFEQLIAEYYRRLGFSVTENIYAGPDGGVDLVLNKGAQITLVQCKQYRNKPVGVSVVREMFGIKEARRAEKVIIVTTCNYTKDAIKFAQGKDIELIDGAMLMPMIQSIQSNVNHSFNRDGLESAKEANGNCPKCGSNLLLRKAKKGPHAGEQFWGCSSFPKCRFVKNIT